MSNIITIAGDRDKPFMKIDKDNGQFIIKGNSFPDDPKGVFFVFMTSLNESIKNDCSILLEIELMYMNTGSKLILNDLIETIHTKSKAYIIKWYYSDEDLLDEIDYMEYCTGAFIKKEYKSLE